MTESTSHVAAVAAFLAHNIQTAGIVVVDDDAIPLQREIVRLRERVAELERALFAREVT